MNDTQLKINEIMKNDFGLYDLKLDTPIFSSNLLDSMDVLRLMIALESAFSIKISAFDVSIEMFETIESIAQLVENKLN